MELQSIIIVQGFKTFEHTSDHGFFEQKFLLPDYLNGVYV